MSTPAQVLKEKEMRAWIVEFWKDEAGQGLPEYGLLVAAVVVVTVGAAALFTSAVLDLYVSIGEFISGESALAS